MRSPQISPSAQDVLSRGYRQVTHVEAQRDYLERRAHDTGNPNRHRDAKALGTLQFHHKVLLATIAALESSDSTP